MMDQAIERGPHNEETIQLAYQIWGFVAGRKVRRVARILQDEYDLSIPLRTLYDWVDRYRWSETLDASLHELAPDIHRQTVAELVFGSLEGARLLRRSVQDDVYLMDDDGNVLTDKDGRPLRQPKPDKNEITSALGLLDRGGFGPLDRLAPRSPDKPLSQVARVDVEHMSLEEAYDAQFKLLSELSSSLVKSHR